MRRNLILLFLCQALLLTGNVVGISSSALVGEELAPLAQLATLPLALQFLSTMAATIPASLFMGRWGRRPGFVFGALAGLSGAALAAVAIMVGSFLLFAGAAVLLGVFNGFGGYYRFAAIEASTEEYRGRAVSYVLAGGVLGAVLGPNTARWAKDIFAEEFAGSYMIVVGVFLLAALLPLLMRLPKPLRETLAPLGRPLRQIAAQPVFVVAALGAMVGYGVMTLLMTATPLAMEEHNHSFSATALVIQWHVLGMFLPSFITGHLIARVGVLPVMLTGAFLAAGSVTAALTGFELGHFVVSLLLLGTAWNFLFIGGTTLLAETYRPEERAKTQALNDFLVFGVVTVASLSAGALQHGLGWRGVNAGVVPLLLLVLTALLWELVRRQRIRTATIEAPAPEMGSTC